jgi:branched-chain amino acid aminotransferase
MVRIRWNSSHGWHGAELIPYGPIEIDPATSVLHYSQSVFEGLKAFHLASGEVAAFRPLDHARRFQRSARRLALPELPEEVFIEAIELLVREDRDWVPTAEDHSLYLRPFMFASEVGIGIRPAADVTFLLIASPVGPYFPSGVKPVTVWLSDDYSRAAPGGTGDVKTGGNYAASLLAQAQATEKGCDQVVWLDAFEHRWVEEMGGMNLYFVNGAGADVHLMTPGLTGTLLPGVTRASILTLAGDLGYSAEEGRISTKEWRSKCAKGSITEVFACGTAAVITPVGAAKSSKGDWQIGDGQSGPVTIRLRRALVDIQRGVTEDSHHWLHRI